jgi:hypothetical protein
MNKIKNIKIKLRINNKIIFKKIKILRKTDKEIIFILKN